MLTILRGCTTHVPNKQSLPSSSSSSSLPLEPPKSDEPISYNAVAQKEAFAKKKELEKELVELQAMTRITTNPEYYRSFSSQVSDIQKSIKSQDVRTAESFSMPSSSVGISDHESIAIAVAL
ncbi:346_t:CDS:2, partial [Dentiscutata heterogama]